MPIALPGVWINTSKSWSEILVKSIKSSFNRPLLPNLAAYIFPSKPLAFNSFEAPLAFLYKQAAEKEIIVVIDEYPYIRNVVKGLDSIIQSFIDNNKSKSKLKLILCGSYVETMKSLL